MTYLTEAEFEARSGMNVTSSSVLLTSTQLSALIDDASALINSFLHTSSDITDSVGVQICKIVCTELIIQRVLVNRALREQNLSTNFASAVMPMALTDAHIRMLMSYDQEHKAWTARILQTDRAVLEVD